MRGKIIRKIKSSWLSKKERTRTKFKKKEELWEKGINEEEKIKKDRRKKIR